MITYLDIFGFNLISSFTLYSPFLEAVFIGGNGGLARQFCANQGGCDDAYRENMLGATDADWCEIDRQATVATYEHCFLPTRYRMGYHVMLQTLCL